MAPERFHDQAATPASDIYSALYEALAGVKPFVETTPLAMAAAVEQGDHRRSAEAAAGFRADLVATVEMAMDHDRGDASPVRKR